MELLTHRHSVVRTEDEAAVAKTNRTICSIGPILDGSVRFCGSYFVQEITLLHKTLHERSGQTNQPVENHFFSLEF